MQIEGSGVLQFGRDRARRVAAGKAVAKRAHQRWGESGRKVNRDGMEVALIEAQVGGAFGGIGVSAAHQVLSFLPALELAVTCEQALAGAEGVVAAEAELALRDLGDAGRRPVVFVDLWGVGQVRERIGLGDDRASGVKARGRDARARKRRASRRAAAPGSRPRIVELQQAPAEAVQGLREIPVSFQFRRRPRPPRHVPLVQVVLQREAEEGAIPAVV